MTTLDVSEGGQLMRTRFGVADLVPPSLSQTILPSVLRDCWIVKDTTSVLLIDFYVQNFVIWWKMVK